MQSSSTITFIIAFVVVLALIGLVAYLVRRFGGNRLGSNANRGRMPRLAVIDAAAVDGRRRLVLVRRDNVEHLLMIGGPTDIVVEPNIIRAGPARDQMSPRSSVGSDLPPRAAPLPDAAGWTDAETRADAFEPMEAPMPEPAPRPTRATFADEVRRPAPPPGNERSAGMMPSPMIRPEPATDSARPSRGEPAMPRPQRIPEPPRMPPPVSRPVERAAPPPPPAPTAPAVPSNAEQNLAEMAQRLEAALRRPGGDAGTAPPVAPEQPIRPAAPAASRNAPNMAPPVMPSPKTGFENLEDEMASLLGRPKTPS